MTADPHAAALRMRERLIADLAHEAKTRRALAAEHEAAGRHEHASLHRFAAGEIEAISARLAVLEPEGACACPGACPPVPVELRRLSDAASPGPWTWEDDSEQPDCHIWSDHHGRILRTRHWPTGEANAAFVVAAVNFVRDLLAATPEPPPSEEFASHNSASVRHNAGCCSPVGDKGTAGWLPIETAPRDIDTCTGRGPVIDLGGPGWAWPGWWDGDLWVVGYDDVEPIEPPDDPTHWRPRPQPPLPAPSEESRDG